MLQALAVTVKAPPGEWQCQMQRILQQMLYWLFSQYLN